jgi:D-inositol-3-phosphate glycosyltransferase
VGSPEDVAAGELRPRILIVSAYATPHLGGVEVIVAQQAQTLASLGYRVTVVTSRCGGGQARERRDGYEVVRVPAWNVLERRYEVPVPIWSPGAAWHIVKLASKADIVHIHDVYHLSSGLAALSARWLRKPLFVTQHVAIVTHDKSSVEVIQRRYYATVAPLLWRQARAISVYNRIVDDFLIDHGVSRDKVHLTYNGVDTTEFRPGEIDAIRSTRAKYGIALDLPVVLFAGRLVPKKGVPQLIRASSPRYQVVLVGPGRIPDDIPEGVIFLGPVSREELLTLYQASDLFALPATGEMLTLAMQEAMACGLPIVTTNERGYDRYDLDPLGVALVTPEAGVLRSTFLEILGDDARRAYMQRYSRLVAEERFDWHKNAVRLAAQYDAAHTSARRSTHRRDRVRIRRS